MSWLVDFVKDREGFREDAYQDSVGVWTVGYGTTRLYGRSVISTDSLTKCQAETKLKDELQSFLDAVVKYGEDNGYKWNNEQIGALTSFTYNLGKASIRQLTDDGKRDDETIARKMLLYVNAGGVRLTGLVKRREAENAQFVA